MEGNATRYGWMLGALVVVLTLPASGCRAESHSLPGLAFGVSLRFLVALLAGQAVARVRGSVTSVVIALLAIAGTCAAGQLSESLNALFEPRLRHDYDDPFIANVVAGWNLVLGAVAVATAFVMAPPLAAEGAKRDAFFEAASRLLSGRARIAACLGALGVLAVGAFFRAVGEEIPRRDYSVVAALAAAIVAATAVFPWIAAKIHLVRWQRHHALRQLVASDDFQIAPASTPEMFELRERDPVALVYYRDLPANGRTVAEVSADELLDADIALPCGGSRTT